MENVSPTTVQQARAAGIAAELAATGFALPGTLIERHVRCGKPGCRCHTDPPVLHGPYWQWTRKAAGKTITRIVPDDQLDDYWQWLDNHRRLRAHRPTRSPYPGHRRRRPARETPARRLRPRHPANHCVTLWRQNAKPVTTPRTSTYNRRSQPNMET